MIETLLVAIVGLLVVVVGLVLIALRRTSSIGLGPLIGRLDNVRTEQARLERAIRGEIAQGRAEAGTAARDARQELSATLHGFCDSNQVRFDGFGTRLDMLIASNDEKLRSLTRSNDLKLSEIRTSLTTGLGDASRVTLEQLERVRSTLTDGLQRAAGELARGREEAATNAKAHREELAAGLKEFGDGLGAQLDRLAAVTEQKLTALTQANEGKLEGLRATVDDRLGQIQRDNAESLERMRHTVDEKLQSTLERRLTESFTQVSERLEQVHQGLGEMQTLATGVGDLKRVLSNVKVRGGWGEVQLGALLEQMLAPDQFSRNVRTKHDSSEAVEFAIRLPGANDGNGSCVWLPIDAKFPLEDYQRLVEASEQSDRAAVEQMGRALEARIRSCAQDISAKYLSPPTTTDFAIMFLPTEGLYAEVARRSGVVEALQRDHRVVVAGPSTLAALLSSLQMGFRTLAIEKRSSEVWRILGAVKTEFGKFGDLLDGVQRKLDEASSKMQETRRRSRAVERKLRDVEVLPARDALGYPASAGGPDGESLADIEEEGCDRIASAKTLGGLRSAG
jgi:DNA recombination protein RmuC